MAREERGYAMVALLILMAVMAVAMTAALPAWSTMARREREAELVFRGEQYARAIMLFQRKYAGTFPPSLDILVEQRFLRKKYKDPITDDDFQPIAVGQAVAGAQSTNPLAPGGAAGRAGAGQQPARGGGVGTTTTGRGTVAPGSVAAGGGPGARGQTGSPFTFGSTTGGGTPAGRAGGFGAVGPTPGIMGVTSKSADASLRVYKGADHYNQWLFIATQATTQAGGRGAQTPGSGVRGGAPPGRPGGPGGGAAPAPGPFGGTNPFGGRGPGPAPAPGRGR